MQEKMNRMEAAFTQQLAQRDALLAQQVNGLKATQVVVARQHENLADLKKDSPVRKVRHTQGQMAGGSRDFQPMGQQAPPQMVQEMTTLSSPAAPHRNIPMPTTPQAAAPSLAVPIMDTTAEASLVAGLERIVALDEDRSDGTSVLGDL